MRKRKIRLYIKFLTVSEYLFQKSPKLLCWVSVINSSLWSLMSSVFFAYFRPSHWPLPLKEPLLMPQFRLQALVSMEIIFNYNKWLLIHFTVQVVLLGIVWPIHFPFQAKVPQDRPSFAEQMLVNIVSLAFYAVPSFHFLSNLGLSLVNDRRFGSAFGRTEWFGEPKPNRTKSLHKSQFLLMKEYQTKNLGQN